ncbi:NAD(P)/FAD-dependent oxidoreductase [Mycolicibacterium sp. HK-90]|uniref:FAD-dependent oxidoreductase n=1 Tax=Mycolicibacterium sp. HK-90 TaxID=3056937 RepID=UPI00265B477B|nr:NAD(P)/FAD-dependent oxidoreductase [Mycolicibacterium sp. HK-90]WKG03991.1 NAD(P)/FAD-dependent oxidoreductase [Mycolicibacterium sp. HK-90]
MTRAIVIGGGVAGPVLAIALKRVGIEAVVYERETTPQRNRGSWLTFQANGMDALRAIGIAESIESLGFDLETISFINGKGRHLGRMPLAAPRDDQQLSQMMRRDELYTALSDIATGEGIDIVHDKELIHAGRTPHGVEARFADGGRATGDLLIGCDGIHSRTRMLIDPAAIPPRYVPVLNIGGYIPNFPIDMPAREFRMQFGTRCFFAWMAVPDGGAVWFANPPMDREPANGVMAGMTDEQWRCWLHELMDGDVGPAPAIIDAAPGPMFGWATYDMPVVRRWRNDRMLIIGDAAHATAPSAGQGAAMAVEDAVILAKCLRDSAGVEPAFRMFESVRRARVQRIVKYGARSATTKAAGPVARIFRDALLPFAFRRAARDGARSMHWLQGHHIDFDEPMIQAGSTS